MAAPTAPQDKKDGVDITKPVNGATEPAVPKADQEAKAAVTDRAYLVFKAENADLKPGDALTFIGEFEATDKATARWAAVDKDPKGLGELVQVPAGSKDGGAFLLAVSKRNAAVERTVEEIEQVKVRR